MANTKLITLNDPRSEAAEAFRSLRTNLMFSSVEEPLHTLLVTSAAQSDGKSSIIANLAVTFAQDPPKKEEPQKKDSKKKKAPKKEGEGEKKGGSLL
jgi:Mrp family chromosome partitioning ATPase